MVKFQVVVYKQGVVDGEVLVNNDLAEGVDLEKFRKAVLFMAVVANVRAQGKEGELKRELKKRNRYLGKMMDVFWSALDKFD